MIQKNFYIAIIFFIIFQIQNILTVPAPPPTSSYPTSSYPSSTSTSTPEATTTPNANGTGITVVSNCVVNGVVALSFDDGPFQFTSQLLDLLKTNNITATFFVNGHNYGCIYDYAGMFIWKKKNIIIIIIIFKSPRKKLIV